MSIKWALRESHELFIIVPMGMKSWHIFDSDP